MNKKVTITLEVDEATLNGLNNAIAAYGDICWSLMLGTEVPAKFEPLKQKSEEEIRARFNALVDFYKKIEEKFNEKQVIWRSGRAWFNAPDLKSDDRATDPQVRILPSPPTRRTNEKMFSVR